MAEISWPEVKEIFLAALECEPINRAAFVDAACGGVTSLRDEVQSLLDHHGDIGEFIEEPAFRKGEVFSSGSGAGEKTFGHYRIIREIGVGGMGAVFLAERTDGEFEQQVAIKIVRQAIADRDLIERFKRERQILASLNHPNIAKLLDGGVTNDGSPFLAMEFIDGDTVTEYVEREKLTLEQRLKLFLKICSAIGYAHRNLVVHRDLKPNNILVDRSGEPKLLDFGLAKLLDDERPSDSGQTQTAFRALTPAFASPEQINGEPLTTATDIYSLGVVFYEMLTGERPYRLEGKSVQEILSSLRTAPPAKPSTAASLQGARTPSINRRSLRGDLDNIALMALRLEPERRYQTVEQFAEDVERYLQGQPIKARPNTFRYRAGKFVKRNAITVTAAALILLSLMGGIAGSLWQARQARREKAKAEAVNLFLIQMLSASEPNAKIEGVSNRALTVNDVLNDAAAKLANGDLVDQPEVRADLLGIIGLSYYYQGKYEAAAKGLTEAIELKTKLYGANNIETVSLSATLASLKSGQGDFAGAEAIYLQVLPLMREAEKKKSLKAEALANSLHDFGVMRRAQGRAQEAEALLREAVALHPNYSNPNAVVYSQAQGTLTLIMADQGRFPEAEKLVRVQIEDARARGTTDGANFAYLLTSLGSYLSEQQSFAEADKVLVEGEAVYRLRLSPVHMALGDNLRIQAYSLYQQNRFLEAETKIDETLKIYRESAKSNYFNYPTAMSIQGLIYAKTNRVAEGEKILREAVDIRIQFLPRGNFMTAFSLGALGECLLIEKRYVEAEPLLREAYQTMVASQGDGTPRTLRALERLKLLGQAKSTGQ